MTYLIPTQDVMVEQVIKKSRFIAYIQRTENKQQALSFISAIKLTHPNARHHCWAYIAGHPSSTTNIAFNDDGEPQGTAGKPIMSVLQHHAIGEISVVIVRYFGGIKLGSGGLIRAYSSSTQLAIETLKTQLLVPTKVLKIKFDYTSEEKVRLYLGKQQIIPAKSEYLEQIFMTLEVEESQLVNIQRGLMNATAGKLSLIA